MKVLQFKTKAETEYQERLDRIQKSLDKINKLMQDLRNKEETNNDD